MNAVSCFSEFRDLVTYLLCIVRVGQGWMMTAYVTFGGAPLIMVAGTAGPVAAVCIQPHIPVHLLH